MARIADRRNRIGAQQDESVSDDSVSAVEKQKTLPELQTAHSVATERSLLQHTE